MAIIYFVVFIKQFIIINSFIDSYMQPNSQMEYRFLGPTGLKVSAISFGSWMYPSPNAEETTYQTVKRALELGINYFDTAEAYGQGLSETHLGAAFKKIDVKREDIVVSTKIFWGTVGGANRMGCSRKRIIEGLNASLKRLQLDYVDILFCHRYDKDTPLEETCRAINTLIKQGKIFYWGTSEWSGQQIAFAIELCDKLGLHGPVVEQPLYNLLHRQRFEVEYGELFDKYRMGSTIWSPLAGGILTGKYLKDEKSEGRLQIMDPVVRKFLHYDEWFGPEKIEKTSEIFKVLEEIAKTLEATLAQLALAWTLRNKDVSTTLCGFSKVSQVEDNVKAVEIYKKITPEIEEKIEKLFNNRPDPGFNFKTFGPLPYRR